MMKRLFFVFFVVVTSVSMAQQRNVYINGSTANAAGKKVWLYRMSDRVSQQEIAIDSAVIDSTGCFMLSTYLNSPTLLVIEIEQYSQSFYAEAGQRYKVRLGNWNWAMDEERNIHLDPIALPLEFMDISPTNINVEVGRFEALVDSFITANRVHFDYMFHPKRAYMDTLQMLVKQARIGLPIEAADSVGTGVDLEALRSYSYESAVFMERYVKCRLAEIAFGLRMESRGSIFNKLIKDQPIRYHDDAYMSMFVTLFEHYLALGNRYVSLDEMTSWVEHQDVAGMIDAMGRDKLLRNEQVRELVALIALRDAFYDTRHYAQRDVVKMVESIGKQSKFADHITLAQQLVAGFKSQARSMELRLPTLPDVEKQPVELGEKVGKWLYIAFVRTNDPNCVGELSTMAHFKDSVYGTSDNIEFVTIDCDREFQTMYHFLRNSRHGNRYSWTWLHFDGNYRMLQDFEVVSYPWFVLIDPEGKPYYDITPAPSTGILMRGPWVEKKEVEKEEFFLRQ